MRLVRVRQKKRPAGLVREPDDVGGQVLVLVLRDGSDVYRRRLLDVVFRISRVGNGARQESLPVFKSVREVFQKEQPENDVLVFGCLHCAP